MKLTALLVLLLATVACAPMIGLHVRHFEHDGVTYTKCVIVAAHGDPALAQASLDGCKDAIARPAEPHQPLKGAQ